MRRRRREGFQESFVRICSTGAAKSVSRAGQSEAAACFRLANLRVSNSPLTLEHPILRGSNTAEASRPASSLYHLDFQDPTHAQALIRELATRAAAAQEMERSPITNMPRWDFCSTRRKRPNLFSV